VYEIRQKVPAKITKLKFSIKSFAIEELDKLVEWYEKSRHLAMDDDHDYNIAALVSFGFLEAAYKCFT
jgi:hypothetical protein